MPTMNACGWPTNCGFARARDSIQHSLDVFRAMPDALVIQADALP